jgi:hypothetical protein
VALKPRKITWRQLEWGRGIAFIMFRKKHTDPGFAETGCVAHDGMPVVA